MSSDEENRLRESRMVDAIEELILRRADRYPEYRRNAVHFVGVGQQALAVSSAVWVDAQEGNPLTVAEADEFVHLFDEATLWYGDVSGDGPMPWVLLHVVDDRGQAIGWEPPLRDDRTEAPKAGGGHLAGRRLRGRSEFPPSWSRSMAIERLQDIAAHPQDGRVVTLPGEAFRAWDVREGVLCEVIVDRAGALLTGYPVSGPHVHHNQGRDDVPVTDLGLDRSESHLVNELGAVVDELTPGLPPWTADSVRGLHRAGEWQLCVRVLAAALAEHGGSIDPARRDQLARLARETGATAVAE